MTGSEHSRSPIADELRAARIRKLNDRFRSSWVGGRFMATVGIQELGPAAMIQIIAEVRAFDGFDRRNDLYSEHDFGAFEHGSDTVFWKIDYYDMDCVMASPDPTDPAVTCRVLTIMLAWEY